MEKSICCLVVAIALADCSLWAEEEVTAERFPDADAVTISEIERVEYQPDGTSVSRNEAWSKILTERGRREESRITLDYNKRYGTARIEYVGAIGTNGVERAIDVSETTAEMTDNSSLSSNIVDPLDRTIVCSIPGLQIGETVHVKIERSIFKSRIKDQWSDIGIFEWSHPILKSVYEVKAPASRPIKSRAIRHPLGNVVEEVKPQPDGSTIYVYTATNSPRMFPEPDMPPQWTQVQAVHLSTAADWRELSRWYWGVCEPHLAKTNPAMTNKVEELGRDMRKIFKFVSQEVRYMGLTMEDTAPGYAPHDVDITFDNRYGVCRDKGALLVAMLRIAGYKAYPVLINVGAKMDPDVPKPYFNHAITCVEENGEYVLMDATNENTKDLCPSYLCNCSYLVARPEGEGLRTSSVPPPEDNAVKVKTRGKLRDDGVIVLESSLDFTGINDTVYRGALAKATQEQRVKFFERRIKTLQPGAELVKCEIAPENMRDTAVPIHVELLAKLPESILRGETVDSLSVPFVSRAFSIANFLLAGNTSLEKRRYPLVLDTTALTSETVEIDLGTALGETASLPETTSLTNGYGFRRSFEVRDGNLTASRRHAVGQVEFSPEEYAVLREDIKAVEAVERRNPSFATDGCKNANVHWLLESTDVDIASDTAWTVTNTVVKEVLTYKGKKDSAEIKLLYNPTWKHVRVLSATVSNLNGVVSSVKPVEMNEVDVSWAAAAPRYPAGKTLIVNLPAVEIGSVISVTTVSTVTNAPAPYYATFGFDARDPLDRRRVRVKGLEGEGVWERDVTKPKRIPDENNQPAAHLWRDVATISKCCFARAAPALRRAAEVGPIESDEVAGAGEQPSIQAIRDWMAKHVRIAGPSLYEVPIVQQLTDPKVVIAERYATRLDYVRTLCALLKGAGYDADIVFAARNASLSEEARKRDRQTYPNVRAFGAAVCRVRETTGGFLGIGGETKTLFIGTENEYTPLFASSMEGCEFFDPAAEEFGTVSTEARGARSETRVEILVRENGAIDYKSESSLWGADVGAFRKRYAEILPEDFARHYQAILGAVAKAASATRELVPDISGYPARLSFECFVPDYATVDGDTITIELPPFESAIPVVQGSIRETPISVDAEDPSTEEVVVRFPTGYVDIECVPTDFVLSDPCSQGRWLVNSVSSKIEDGCLAVRIRRQVVRRFDSSFGPQYAELFRDWRRSATSRASRTLVIRRKTK